jgi:predicted nucleotidyltransferase
MDPIRTSIFATILYYDSFNLPLTLAEVYKYLVNPKRFLRHAVSNGHGVSVCPSEIVVELDNMARAGLIGHKNGFYFMPGKDDLYERRIEKDKLANRKWKKFLAIVKYLQFAPYLRAVFASGSLAANNPEPKSDFDVFIVIKSGRLYTGRLFLWLISSLLGARRGRFDIVAPDKLCFNYYVTDDNLEIHHRSLYIAQSLANLKPVIVFDGVLDAFIASNKWANSYCYNFRQVSSYRNIKPNKFMLGLARCGEVLLNNFFGNILEKTLLAFQQKRIKNNPATYESGGRIIFTDKELEFHPRSFEKVVIDNYNNGLKKFGVFGFEENDSGLQD